MRLSLLSVLLLIVLTLMQYRLWSGSGSIYDWIKLKRILSTQTEENETLKKQNEELVFEVFRLKNSDDAAESRARSELGMIKNGETFYQVVKE